jgi:hypothetical protein
MSLGLENDKNKKPHVETATSTTKVEEKKSNTVHELDAFTQMSLFNANTVDLIYYLKMFDNSYSCSTNYDMLINMDIANKAKQIPGAAGDKLRNNLKNAAMFSSKGGIFGNMDPMMMMMFMNQGEGSDNSMLPMMMMMNQNKDGKDNGDMQKMLPMMMMMNQNKGKDGKGGMDPMMMMMFMNQGEGSDNNSFMKQYMFAKLGEQNPQMKQMISLMSLMGNGKNGFYF